MSLPVRECGLKSDNLQLTSFTKSSLPVRECGLKLEDGKTGGTLRFVTPCAGVWIEIHNYYTKRYPKYVTPCAGVWIEIAQSSVLMKFVSVTPCAGVWIEICQKLPHIAATTCHSLCGSVDWNTMHHRWIQAIYMSLPVRECGLKSHLSLLFALAEIVTPCAGVWIEIPTILKPLLL